MKRAIKENPIITIIAVLLFFALGGLGSYVSTSNKIAVLQTEIKHMQLSICEMKENIKELSGKQLEIKEMLIEGLKQGRIVTDTHLVRTLEGDDYERALRRLRR